jgi:carbamoyltransferase
MKNICLGFSVGHNRGAAITVDGEIKVSVSNERITRRKTDHSKDIPEESIDYCLNALGITYADVDLWVYNITEEDVDIPAQFEEFTGLSREKLEFVPHHMAHAYSTFYASNFEEAVVVVVDAMGSLYNDQTPIKKWYQLDESQLEPGQQWGEAYSIYKFTKDNARPEPVYKKWTRFPFQPPYEGSIGYLYGMGSKQLVYSEKHNTWQAGKLMGLASYADKEWVDKQPEYSIRTESDLQVPTAPIMEDVANYKSDFQAKANIAGLYQREQELNSMHLVEMAKKMTGMDSLCVAGGSFLNCNTNEMIIKSGLFENNYFLPPADDSGIPIGCAFFGSSLLEATRKIPENWMPAYLGKTYSDKDVEEAVKDRNDVFAYKYTEEGIIELAALALSENKVIGWFNGGSENGPRALGNRSILANPSKKWMVEYINSEIKKREWYRPFAPSVLFERQAEIFDLDVYSPYMLVTTTVKPEWRERIPAVTHFDHTSRYQSVTPQSNEKYHKLISRFEEKTGIPVVLNTSFNGPEEPIVETPTDAINTMLKHDLYALFINNYVIMKKK